jgi:hypothetical protein
LLSPLKVHTPLSYAVFEKYDRHRGISRNCSRSMPIFSNCVYRHCESWAVTLKWKSSFQCLQLVASACLLCIMSASPESCPHPVFRPGSPTRQPLSCRSSPCALQNLERTDSIMHGFGCRRLKKPILHAEEKRSSPRVCILRVGDSVSDYPVIDFARLLVLGMQPKGGGP